MKEIKFDKGLTEEKVIEISKIKNEPDWMRDFRVNSYNEFIKKDLPSFGPKIDIDFDDITYYKRIDNKIHNTWNEVDNTVKNNSFDYNFENNEQIISISRTPKLNNVKNDFCVWGKR